MITLTTTAPFGGLMTLWFFSSTLPRGSRTYGFLGAWNFLSADWMSGITPSLSVAPAAPSTVPSGVKTQAPDCEYGIGLVTLRKNLPSASWRLASRTVVATGTHLVRRRRTIAGSLKTVTRPNPAEPQHGPSGCVPPLLEIHKKTGFFSLAASARASRTDSFQGIAHTFSPLIFVSFLCSR